MKTNTVLLFCLLSFSIKSFPQLSWPNMVRIYYKTAADEPIDNIVIRFSADSTVTLEESTEWDARSLNCCNFIASLKGDVNFAIQTRPLNFIRDTVRLRVESTSTGNFKLAFTGYGNFAQAKQIFLLDQYTGIEQEVKTYPVYPFTITTDAGSQGADRFKLVFVANPLSVTCPASLTVNNDAGSNGAIVNFNPTVIARCSSPIIQYSQAPGSFFTIGQTQVTINVSDSCGNLASCNFTVTVKDAEAPVILAPGALQFSTDAGTDNYSFTPVPPTITDNSNTYSLQGVRNDGDQLNDPYPLGNTIITWTATDAAGNSSSVTQLVTVADTEAPVISVQDVMLATDAGSCFASTMVTPATAADNVELQSLTAERSDGNSAGAAFAKGITNIIWTATDIAGNRSTVTQKVEVRDLELPVINGTAVANNTANYSGCRYQVADASLDPVTTDNCSGVSLVNNFNHSASLAGAVFGTGNHPITWTATDASGNTTNWVQTINVSAAGIEVQIPDANVLAQGTNANTVYLGYAPASVLTLNAVSPQAVSYQWSSSPELRITGSAATAIVQVTANATNPVPGWLYLTATNSIGCTATAQKQIAIISVSCGPRNDKVSVCPPAGGKSLCVTTSSVAGYLQKGYMLGACGSTTAAKETEGRFTPVSNVAKVFPNPGTGLFRVSVAEMQPVKIIVSDAMGKMLLQQEFGRPASQLQVDLRRFPAGIYHLQVLSGDQRSTTKLVKI